MESSRYSRGQECQDVARRRERGAGGTHLPLDIVGDGGSLLLDDVDLGLDVGADVLEVTDDGAVDGAGKVGVALGEELGRVAHVVQDCLPSLGREDVALVERDVDGLGESGGRPGSGVLDVDETLRGVVSSVNAVSGIRGSLARAGVFSCRCG